MRFDQLSWLSKKKEPARNHFQAGSLIPTSLRQLNRGGNDDDGGGGSSSDARDTSSMTAQNSSHSRDMVGSIHMDNSCIRNRGSHNSRRIRPQLAQLRPKRWRQNAAREQKPVHLPPMQLTEAFSYNFPSCLLFRVGMEHPAKDFLGALKIRLSL